MFDIGFIEGEPPYIDEDGWSGLWARIVLGEFSESFASPIGIWGRDDYERQWINGANRLIDGEAESAFVAQAGRLWWTAWREGEWVLVQQRLLVEKHMSRAWSAYTDRIPYELVGKRASHDADSGERLSQWVVGVSDLRGYITRRARNADAR